MFVDYYLQTTRMTSLKKLGQKIAETRHKSGLSQEDLAGKADNMDRSYLSELENGHKNPSFLMLERIAKAMKVKVSDLIPE